MHGRPSSNMSRPHPTAVNLHACAQTTQPAMHGPSTRATRDKALDGLKEALYRALLFAFMHWFGQCIRYATSGLAQWGMYTRMITRDYFVMHGSRSHHGVGRKRSPHKTTPSPRWAPLVGLRVG